MARTLQLSKAIDDRLTALAAQLYQKTRKKVTKRGIVTLLVELCQEDDDALAARIAGIRYPISDRVWRGVRNRIRDWGVDTGEETVDSVLYGDRE